MHLAELFGIVLVTELFVTELFAGQIENAVTNHIVAVGMEKL